ncbi:hypothetical protein RND71_019302 [Anisodus tanguticus]|uniref:Uncharacterized protein n=1 Tax=Anisodus tanguticus TaxID=243964 RepID=A0AAE1RYS8_9SOLA|nr:hypothetical protein RND71_019302 [Anisodus tanguticus]
MEMYSRGYYRAHGCADDTMNLEDVKSSDISYTMFCAKGLCTQYRDLLIIDVSGIRFGGISFRSDMLPRWKLGSPKR